MAVFQHVLWGYELTYPDDWIHRTTGGDSKHGEVEAFAMIPEALTADYQGPRSGQILLRAEFNSVGQPIEPIWNRHVAMIASWLGAKQVGSAPWKMAGASGIEAEIVLPKKDERRLWTGILQRNLTVLNFLVLHLKEEYLLFQPLATQIIASLRFPQEVAGVLTSEDGFPLPPDYVSIPPQDILQDIRDPANWRAYDGQHSIDSLQAFYLREAPNFGWSILEFIPLSNQTDLGFARLKLKKGDRAITLGIMPYQEETSPVARPARLVIKTELVK